MRLATSLALLVVAASSAQAQDQQLGARTKAMGGSYTAFEDDPVSIWLNPAGIATQPDQFALFYHTYTTYELDRTSTAAGTGSVAETSWANPAIVPSYTGFVFQLGTPETPMALGVCFARPFHLKFSADEFEGPGQTNPQPGAGTTIEESLFRLRFAFACDFRFKNAGETGFLTHAALGVGADIGYEHWEFYKRSIATDTVTNVTSDDSLGYGGGVGLLLGVYDNAESFKVNLGVAYQSPVGYDYNLNRTEFPQFDMPQQLNAGLTFYLLQGMPLRLTFDTQWVDWSRSAEKPLFPNQPAFEDSLNYSVGAEYLIRVSEKINLFPRLGLRRFDAPWEGTKNQLPMTGKYKLVLDTQDSPFLIYTFGAGVSWRTEADKMRTVDIAGDVGGDAYNLAFGFTFEL